MAGTLTNLPGLSSVTAAITVSSSATSATTTTTQASTTQQGAIVSLSGLPIIAGAGIPTITVPYTANAPFMQKSNYPEGTVFIAVGAVLAFLGGCVLLWRGLVAWSINRSVKRAALAALGTEKATSGWTSGRGGAVYKGLGAGSNLSLDALTSSGKPIRSHYKDDQRRESTPPAGLFFSPTARAVSGGNMSSRNSSYLPAGYYASPAAQTGGSANSPILGASVAPYARNSMHQPSPPGSPYLGAQQRNSPHQRRAMSREGLHAMGNTSVRNSYVDARLSHVSGLHQSHTPSDLLSSNQSNENLGGSRAPSQVFDTFLQGHKPNSRERY